MLKRQKQPCAQWCTLAILMYRRPREGNQEASLKGEVVLNKQPLEERGGGRKIYFIWLFIIYLFYVYKVRTEGYRMVSFLCHHLPTGGTVACQ